MSFLEYEKLDALNMLMHIFRTRYHDVKVCIALACTGSGNGPKGSGHHTPTTHHFHSVETVNYCPLSTSVSQFCVIQPSYDEAIPFRHHYLCMPLLLQSSVNTEE